LLGWLRRRLVAARAARDLERTKVEVARELERAARELGEMGGELAPLALRDLAELMRRGEGGPYELFVERDEKKGEVRVYARVRRGDGRNAS